MKCLFNPLLSDSNEVLFTHICPSCKCVVAIEKKDFIQTSCICCVCDNEIKFSVLDLLKYEWFNYYEYLTPYNHGGEVMTLEHYEKHEHEYEDGIAYYGYIDGYLPIHADCSLEWLGYKIDKPTHVIYFK